jgi:hypothetical protein
MASFRNFVERSLVSSSSELVSRFDSPFDNGLRGLILFSESFVQPEQLASRSVFQSAWRH